MKVTVENKKGLNKDLKVFIDKKTMNSYMDEKYEEIKGTVNLKGFRPGKVPFGMIEKQYGKSVLAEELNKLANDSLYKYITEEKLEILGNPIPTEDEKFKGDMEDPGDFEFAYEIGFSPKFDIPISSNKKDS